MATQKMSLQTSLLGYSYVASEPGIVKKLLWVLVVFAAYAFATYFIQDNIQEYISSTDVTSTNSTTASLQDIHFPSAVLCNINQVSRAFINSINVDSAEGWSVLENQFLHDNSELNEKFLVTGVEDPIYKEKMDELERIIKDTENMYRWNRTQSFVKLASQVCEGYVLDSVSVFIPSFFATF